MAHFYLNPGTGNDGNPGTIDQPILTIAHLNTIWSPGDTVFLARGYDYGNLSVANKDGTELNPYTWDAYGTGTNPIFSGFINPATNWVSEGGNLYSYTNVSFQDAKFLLIGGERKGYGRWPKRATAEYYDINAAIGNTQITDNTNLSGQPSYIGGEMVTKKKKWTIDRSPITGQTSTTLTMTGTVGNFVEGNGYFVQNHQNACTENGEWAFDSANDKVYLYSTTDPNTLEIKISFYQKAAHINRSDYHIFNNIIFEGAYENNIYLEQLNHVTFNNCTSRFAGVNGLRTFVAANITWNNGAMYDINNHGINNRDASPNLTVTGSSFVRIADIPGMGESGNDQQCGIFINNTEHNNILTDNYFLQIGNCGIIFRGNNSYVARNFAKNCAYTVSDAACYYTFGDFSTPYTGIICEENIGIDTIGNIDGIGGTPKFDSCGIYTDDNSKNVIVRKNYIENCSRGLYIHNNQDVNYNNNIVYDCANSLFIADDNVQGVGTTLRVRNIDVQNNIFIALAGQKIVSCITLGTFSGDDPFLYGVIDNNQINAVESDPFNVDLIFNFNTDYNLADWRTTYGFDINSNTTPYDISKTIQKVNDTGVIDTFPLVGTYQDWDGNTYDGSITLEPNESKLLFFESNILDYALILEVDPTGSGTVTQIPASPHAPGTQVTLTAVPESSNTFQGWFDGITQLSANNPYIYTTGSSAKTLTARLIGDCMEISHILRAAIINALSPLVVEGITIPIFDERVNPSATIPSLLEGNSYVLIKDQQEVETTNDKCSFRQNALISMDCVVKYPVNVGSKLASELISCEIQNKINKSIPVVGWQVITVSRVNATSIVEQGLTQTAYRKLLTYQFDVYKK